MRTRSAPHDRDQPAPRAAEGVFETMLVVAGQPLELAPHLRRLAASVLALYGASLPADVPELLAERARGLRLGRIRVTVRPVDGGAVASEVTAAAIEPGIVLPTTRDAAPALRPYTIATDIGEHKWADRALFERLEAEARPQLPLIVDPSGAVLEASRANVFVVRDGTVTTPPADGRILPGVTRALVLELAAEAGIGAGEAAFSLEDLLAADEVFLTGAVRGVEPVCACGETRWQPGQVTARLAAALRQRWL
jgi:para-aminobenzoate synthetase / 4-amino-4-deoxychorismate lyase